MNDNPGLLIAALVAIVAVVGLVILFSGASTGQAFVKMGPTPWYSQAVAIDQPVQYMHGHEMGTQLAQECNLEYKDRDQCCSRACEACGISDECHRACTIECEHQVKMHISEYATTYRRN